MVIVMVDHGLPRDWRVCDLWSSGWSKRLVGVVDHGQVSLEVAILLIALMRDDVVVCDAPRGGRL